MITLISSSCCILDWEWIKMSSTLGVNVWMELVSLARSASTILHLDEVQWTTDWSMHVLEFPFTLFLLTLSNLSLPNLPIIRLGILFGLSSHLKISSIMLNLGIEFCFFDVSLVLELVNLIKKAAFSSAEGRSSGLHVLLNL